MLQFYKNENIAFDTNKKKVCKKKKESWRQRESKRKKSLPSKVFCVKAEDLLGLDVVFGMCVNNALKKLYNCNKLTRIRIIFANNYCNN